MRPVATRLSPSRTNSSRPSPVNGSWPSVCGPPVLVVPNVLRFGCGVPSDVRVPGDGSPAADAGEDVDAAGVDAVVVFGPEATDGVASMGPDCAVPVEPVAVFPPATCAVPIELVAEFVPPPPTVTGTDVVVPPAPVAVPAVIAPDCAARNEPVTVLPPPT